MRPSCLKTINPDVIVEMLEMACSLEKWNKVKETAEILYECVQCLYQEQQYRKAKSLPLLTFELEHPMVYYYGFSHLMGEWLARRRDSMRNRVRTLISMPNWDGWRIWVRMGWRL